jgi:hypothetical protein
MNQESRDRWINEVLNEVFLAVIAWEPLRDALIFKGARILSLHLGDFRESLDIDSNIAPELVASTPDLAAQADFLEAQVTQALRRHFEEQSPVRFKLEKVKVEQKPAKSHPHGWDAFLLKIKIEDNLLAGTLGLPSLDIDVAAPELLGPDAVETLTVKGIPAQVYSLHRIAGEKLRAYLTSLPAYRRKMNSNEREFRVKDLHDIARILRARPAEDSEFWSKASHEFCLACESRLVDCRGLESFKENWEQVRERYESDKSLSKISFEEAEQALETVVGLFNRLSVFPLSSSPQAR